MVKLTLVVTASATLEESVVVIPAYLETILPFKLSFSVVGVPSLDVNPSSNANDEDPVDTFVAVVIDVPTLAAN